MRSKILRFVLPLFVIGFAFVIASYLKWTKPSVEPKPLTERAWTVSVIPAKIENIQPRIKLFGEIVSGRTIDLRPEVSGKIIQASPNLVEGGIVSEGEVIAPPVPLTQDRVCFPRPLAEFPELTVIKLLVVLFKIWEEAAVWCPPELPPLFCFLLAVTSSNR